MESKSMSEHAPVTERHRELFLQIESELFWGGYFNENQITCGAQFLSDALAVEAKQVRRQTLEENVKHLEIGGCVNELRKCSLCLAVIKTGRALEAREGAKL